MHAEGRMASQLTRYHRPSVTDIATQGPREGPSGASAEASSRPSEGRASGPGPGGRAQDGAALGS